MNKAWLRRLFLGLTVLGLLAGNAYLTVANTDLAKAVSKKQEEDIKPHIDPVPNPEPTPSLIQPILDKLKADGCNLNPTATKRGPLGNCKVLLIGDSLGNNLAYGMIPQLDNAKTLTFTRTAKASTGLSNPWFYNWHTNLAAFLKTYSPNLVIVMIGANDRQDYVINGVRQVFGSDAWKQTYRSNITKIITASTKSGAYVLWVGLPIMKPYNYAKGETLIDQQFALTVPKSAGATYLATRAYTADASGNYRRDAYVNGVLSQIRGDDGIHFSTLGQSVIATYVINAIVRTYKVEVPPKAGKYITK